MKSHNTQTLKAATAERMRPDLMRRLHLAVDNGDESAIRASVAAGADMDHVFGMQGTALCRAITAGNDYVVSLLLELGCDVNGEDYDGGFPLALALHKRLSKIALILIHQPACDLNVLDPVSKQRPLCSAVQEGLTQVVERLVQDPRCDITQRNGLGNSALHISLLHKEHAITQILARCEGLRSLRNLAGHAPVHIAATVGDCDSLSLLFPSSSTRTAETFHASDTGDACLLSLQSSQHRELDQQVTVTGDTALHLAVRGRLEEMANALIQLGARVDIQNNRGQTPLLLACAADLTDLATRLLEHGAAPNLAGHVHVPQRNMLGASSRNLLGAHSRESSLTPLHIAASLNNTKIVEVLCKFGANINNWDERGRSVLYVALLNGAGDVAKYMLSLDTLIVQPSMRLSGSSLLHAVCHCESHAADITTALLELGCVVNERNHFGMSPLHEALCWENIEVARVLLQYGADPNVPGETNVMPLTFAARTGHLQLAKLLLAAGADVNGGHSKGNDSSQYEPDSEDECTPFKEALQAGMVDFARFLVDIGCDLNQEKYIFQQLPSTFPDWNDMDDSDDDDDDDDDDEDDYVFFPKRVQENRELWDWLRLKARQPHSMLQLSLEAIRCVFRQGDPPFALMIALPLPEKIITKLYYGDV